MPQGAQHHHPLWKHLVSLFICSSSSPQMTLSSGPMCYWFRRRLERIQGRPVGTALPCAQAGLLGSWGKAQVWISSVTSACNSVQSWKGVTQSPGLGEGCPILGGLRTGMKRERCGSQGALQHFRCFFSAVFGKAVGIFLKYCFLLGMTQGRVPK